ncbi:uncharacterized protein LOC126906555 [Daktulosphaira vitifoliae]|uniref:uncharacterized protein LOC126906555 n=1 Tax=Daktulosphaira vitifoliae TaxID=58002 RepID=UPI0021AA2916|nr:uncharacterized protein LOC126906555 [Daktulosphaira vitifoliae]
MYGVCCRLEGTVDSIPQGLLDGRPASSLVLTHHQYQQLQHIQAQQEQAATGGQLTLTLHHQTSGTGTNGVLSGTPQLVLASSQGQGLSSFPSGSSQQAATLHQHTSIQQVLHQHVQHSNILHSTSIRQMGAQQHTSGTMVQQQQATAILDTTNSKCIPPSPGSPFSSRSLTPSPQQRVITPQPQVIHQVMSANGPVLQFIQPNSRNNVNNIQVKSKPPPQILPKPIGSNNVQNHTNINSIKTHQSHHSTSIHSQQGAFLINQIMPTAGVLVGPQATGGLQLILRSPNTQQTNSQQVTCNGTQILLQQPRQQSNQVVRLVSGQSVQLQQIQTCSGPALVALPATTPPSTITPPLSNNRSMNIKKKKPKIQSRPHDDEPVRLDLANLIKLSGIDEEDSIAPMIQQSQINQTNKLQQTSTPPPNQNIQQNTPLLAQIHTPTSSSQGGFRLSLGEDGRMIVHQPQITTNTLTQSVSASVAAAAQTQLAQLVADHGGHILQNAVLSVSGAESLLLKSGNTMLPPQPQNGSGVRILADVSGRLQIVTVLEPQSLQQNILNGQHLMFPTTGTPVNVENRQNHQQFVMSTPVDDQQSKVMQQNNSIRVMHSSSTMVSSLDHQQSSSIQLVSNLLDSRVLVANNDTSSNNDIVYNEEQNRLQIVTNSSTLNKNVEIQNQPPIIHTSERLMQTSVSRSKTVPVSTHSPRSIQSVISPQCSPAMSHTSRSNSKSPASYNSPIPSPNVPQSFTPMLPNRPNLTIVTSPQQTHMQFSKPCAAVISQSNENHMVLTNYQTSVVNRPHNKSPVAISSKTFQPNSPKSSIPPEVQSQNAFLDSIAQSHPNILINKTMVVPPCANKTPIKPRKVKRAAVVKPMVFQCDEKEKEQCSTPIPLNSPESSISNQRVKTIQLTPQKQQLLKSIQNQISALGAKKFRTNNEQMILQKLFNEQQKILQCGKIVPTLSGQNSQGITYVSTPVRLVPPPCAMMSSPPHTTSPPLTIQSSSIVSPLTSNKATSPLHVQVGTQTSCEPSPVPPTFSAAKRISLISERLEADQLGATNPDVNTPFSSRSDAVKRLARYHCLNDAVLSERDLELADEIFESTAKHLLDKKASLFNKYRYLLLKESMREVQTSELIMLGRIISADESGQLQQLKQSNTASVSSTSVAISCTDEQLSKKREHPVDEEQTLTEYNKRQCPDDEEINAQVQNAIDSILNLQRSDPATDEAVRSILPS